VKRWLVAGLATAAVLGTGTAYAVNGDGSTATYRTVAATIADVEQTLSTTGSVDAAKRADLAFGTDGTVAQVLVEVGDTVKSGQVIARLDTTDLEAALTQAKAQYAQAVAQLASDRQAQASAVSSPTEPTTPSSSSSAQALKKAQDQVIVAQSHASQAIAAAKEALAAQHAACVSTPTATPSATATDAPSPADDDTSCAPALAAVQQAQDVVSRAQDELAKALNALGQVLSRLLAEASAASDASSPSDDNASSGPTVTAAQLASDQARIEQANATVVSAKQNLAQATLRSTRSGTVVALDTAAGETVTAGSTVATVVGGTAVTVTATVTESQVDSVKVGQTVRVSVPGISKETTGKVTSIGLVADSSSGTTSYPVTVTVENPTISLPAGSRASIQIVLATAKHVVTVPTSAVTRTGTGTSATVSTWNGSTLTRRTVQLGAVGDREVAITSGLTAGTRVVLADVDKAITGAATSVNDRGSFAFPAGGNFPAPAGAVTFSKAG